MGTGIAAVQTAVADLKLPPSIRVEYGGTYQEQQKSFRDLTTVLVLAVVLIFLVLLFEFRSFTPPVAILASALLSTSGVFFALLITRTTFNVSSFMGLIMVIGIVAKNGILLLDANEKFLATGLSREEAIIQAGRRRLRPIVMTALAAVAGMMPLALALGAGSQMLAAARHRRHRRHPHLDAAVAGRHAGDSVLPGAPAEFDHRRTSRGRSDSMKGCRVSRAGTFRGRKGAPPAAQMSQTAVRKAGR